MRLENPLITVLLILAFQACICTADSGEVRHPYAFGGMLAGRIVEEVCVGARMGSYKPDLSELDRLLAQFDIDAPGASTMYNIFARFKGSPRLSYLLEVGYWENDVSVESTTTINVGATFTNASLCFLYYPELIQTYIPLYLGIGGGVARAKLTGNALDRLRDVIKERENTGACANFVIGLEYMILERLMVSVQANHIFKRITVNEEKDLKFSFDGTVVSLGVFGRF